MATSLTFDSLLDDLRAYLERGTSVDPTVFDQLPRLINLAERDISRELKILGFLGNFSQVLTTGQFSYNKPSDWVRTVSISLYPPGEPVRFPIFSRSHDYCRSYWPNDQLEAQPIFYSDYDYDNRRITPTPDDDYRLEEIYYRSLPLLDATVQTNWLTDKAPQALLHGSLLHCSRFLKNDERVPLWESAYKSNMAMLDAEDIQRMLDRSASREEV